MIHRDTHSFRPWGALFRLPGPSDDPIATQKVVSVSPVLRMAGSAKNFGARPWCWLLGRSQLDLAVENYELLFRADGSGDGNLLA